MTNRELMALEYRLSDKDRQILRILKEAKCLFSYHIRRLFFYDISNVNTATRSTNRTLKRLSDYGLIDVMMERRIGGIRKGSSSNIWYLTERGHKLLTLDQKYETKRARFLEPANSTLGHRMAINECYVVTMEMEQKGKLRVKEASFEPDNWRSFTYEGKTDILKPDLFLAVSHHGYEYRFFVEMDLSTEAISTIIDKCFRYHKYLSSGKEQKAHGVFPITLWIVRDEKRKAKMEDAIKAHFKTHPDIFVVITADEYESIMTPSSIPADYLC